MELWRHPVEIEALLLGSLATWRVTHLLSSEDGPWNLVARLRERVGNGFWGRLLDCPYCLSLWVALPVALVLRSLADGLDPVRGHPLEASLSAGLQWLALSAGALVWERVIDARGKHDPLPSLSSADVAAIDALRLERLEGEAEPGREPSSMATDSSLGRPPVLIENVDLSQLDPRDYQRSLTGQPSEQLPEGARTGEEP